jgi:hypothetical protein
MGEEADPTTETSRPLLTLSMKQHGIHSPFCCALVNMAPH